MTTWNFLALNRGDLKEGDVVASTSTATTNTPTTDFFVSWTTTHSPTREDIILLMRTVERYLLAGGLPAGYSARGTDLPVL